ncbi:MAG: hypothetical protein CL625_01915, partial [Arenimonas sp.]|nr:hypothetical protein [Arenimonas sp.]
MRAGLACVVLLLAACAGKPTRPDVPVTEPAGSPRSAPAPGPAAASAQALQAACLQVREHRDEDYTAGGLYAPGVPDSAPTDPLDISGLAEPEPRHEPLARYGNRSPYTVLGKSYRVLDRAEGYRERGIASWYGQKFHGRHTSSREIYDMCSFSAAHKTLPLPSFARVTRLDTGDSVVVRVNDRGPFHDGRIIDLSYAAAVKLGLDRSGTAKVEVEALVPAGDAPRLAATDPATRLPALAPAPVPAAAPADDGRRRILQVGAYRERDNARRIARQ